MKTLAQFKQEEGVNQIDLIQNKGRAFATVNDKNLIVSSECKLNEPLFVIPMSQDKEGNPVMGVYLIINSTSKHIASV